MDSNKILSLLVVVSLPLFFLPQPASAQKGTTVITDNVLLANYDVAASNITAHDATVSWKTNSEATSRVFYDTEFHQDITGYGFSTIEDTTLVIDHSMCLTGLSPGTTYHYRVRSAIPGTEFMAISDDYTFTTLTIPPATDWTVITARIIGGLAIIVIVLLVYISWLRRIMD